MPPIATLPGGAMGVGVAQQPQQPYLFSSSSNRASFFADENDPVHHPLPSPRQQQDAYHHQQQQRLSARMPEADNKGGNGSYATAAAAAAGGSSKRGAVPRDDSSTYSASPIARPGSSSSGSDHYSTGTGTGARRSMPRDRSSDANEHHHVANGSGHTNGVNGCSNAPDSSTRQHQAQRSHSLSVYPASAGSPLSEGGGGAGGMAGSMSQGALLETMHEHHAEDHVDLAAKSPTRPWGSNSSSSAAAAATGGAMFPPLSASAVQAQAHAQLQQQQQQRHRSTSSAAALSLHHAAVQDDLARSRADWSRAAAQDMPLPSPSGGSCEPYAHASGAGGSYQRSSSVHTHTPQHSQHEHALDSYGARAFSPHSASGFGSVAPFVVQFGASSYDAGASARGSQAGAGEGGESARKSGSGSAGIGQQPRRAIGFNVSGPAASRATPAPAPAARLGASAGSSALSLDDLAADLDSLDVGAKGSGGNSNGNGNLGRRSAQQQEEEEGRKIEMRVPSSQAAMQGAHASSMPGYNPHDHVHLFGPSASPSSHRSTGPYGGAWGTTASSGNGGDVTLVSSPVDSPPGFALGAGGSSAPGGPTSGIAVRSRYRAASIGPTALGVGAGIGIGGGLASGLASGQETPLARVLPPRTQSYHHQLGASQQHVCAAAAAAAALSRSPASEHKVPGSDFAVSAASPASSSVTGTTSAGGPWTEKDLQKVSSYSSASSISLGPGPPGAIGSSRPPAGAYVGGHARAGSSASYDGYGALPPPASISVGGARAQNDAMLATLGLPQLSDFAIHSLATLGPLSPAQGGSGGGSGGGGGHDAGPASLQELGKGVPLQALPGEMPLYIVEFKQGRTDLYFKQQWATHDDFDVCKGDLVVVEADRGKDLGTVVNDSINVAQVQSFLVHQNGMRGAAGASAGASDSKVRLISPKRLYGRATPADTALLYSKAQDEERALQLCVTKVTQRGLPMSVIAAEMQWDRRKLTFYYTANVRVDFRDLVKELFRLYKTRIWMCNIGHPSGP